MSDCKKNSTRVKSRNRFKGMRNEGQMESNWPNPSARAEFSSSSNLYVRKQEPRKRLLSLPRNNRIYGVPDENPNCRPGSFCESNSRKSTDPTCSYVLTRQELGVEVEDNIITPGPLVVVPVSQDPKLITEEREGASLPSICSSVDLWDSPSGHTGTVKRRPTITINQGKDTDSQVSIFTARVIPAQPGVNSSQNSQNFGTPDAVSPKPCSVPHFSLSKITPYSSDGKESGKRNMGSILTRQGALTSARVNGPPELQKSPHQIYHQQHVGKTAGKNSNTRLPFYKARNFNKSDKDAKTGRSEEGQMKLKQRKTAVVGPQVNSTLDFKYASKVTVPTPSPTTTSGLRQVDPKFIPHKCIKKIDVEGALAYNGSWEGKAGESQNIQRNVEDRAPCQNHSENNDKEFKNLGHGDSPQVSCESEGNIWRVCGDGSGSTFSSVCHPHHDTSRALNEQTGLDSGDRERLTNGINFQPMDSFSSTETENYSGSNGSDSHLDESINNSWKGRLGNVNEDGDEGMSCTGSYGSSFLLDFVNFGTTPSKRIYTDWANHYLEKARCKRQIQDLQVDVTDGVILSDVVEAVTSQKVPDIVRKPKNSSQMLDNIQASLVYLTNLGVSLEGISARDIRDGHLKSILSLFFQLSRYKQQQKQQDRDRHNLQRQNGDSMMQPTGIKNPAIVSKDGSKLPSAFGNRPLTSIPIPSSGSGNGSSVSNHGLGHGNPGSNNPPSSNPNPSALSIANKKTAQEKGKSGLGIGPASHHHTYANTSGGGSLPVKPASGSSSRSTSPSATSGIPHSFIPTPRSSIPSAPSSARSSLHEKHLNNAKNSCIAGPPSSKSSVRVHNNNSVNSAPHSTTGSNNSPLGPANSPNAKNNSSMLEKFKFFKDKDKGEKLKSSTGSKRTSSSSGFSSARSERSDSSVSLCSESKTGLVEGSSAGGVISRDIEKERDHSGGNNGSIIPQSSILGPTSGDQSTTNVTSTPRLAIKGFRQKIGKAIASKDSKGSHHSSPKSSRKETENSTSSSNGPAKGLSSSSVSKGQPDGRKSGFESQEKHLSSGGKGRVPRSADGSVDSGDSNCQVNGPNPGSASFLRQPKPSSANGPGGGSRDSRNRFSSTGIPTRNSLLVSNNNSHSRDELHHSNGLAHDTGGSTSSVNSSMSSINGVVQPGGGNGTGIPKPTAAVKGTTKQLTNGPSSSSSKEGLRDSQSGCVGNSISKNKPAPQNTNPGKVIQSPDPQDSLAKVSNPPSSKPGALRLNEPNKVKQASATKEDVSSTSAVKSSIRSAAPVTKATTKAVENVSNGITVAMIAPMPSLTNSVSNSASVSSVESSSQSQSLSHSQLSSLSLSNSSEASVILVKGAQIQKQPSSEEPVICPDKLEGGSTSERSFVNQLEITGDSNAPSSSNKVSPMSIFGSGSVSSSMGSLKCVVESSSGASSSGECSGNGSNGDDNPMTMGTRSRPAMNLSPNNGNEVIPECDEDELLLNVTPMEPLTYEYIKSPPSGHQTPGFLSPKSSVNGGSCMRLGSCENGNANGSNGRLLNRPMFNPYCDPARLMIRKDGNRQNGKYGSSQYASSLDQDYTEIDNLDVTAAGYLSDGDLFHSGSNGNRPSDGYLSESGTSMYPRRLNQQQNGRKDIVPSSGGKSYHLNYNGGSGNNNKHGLIPEDSFDDSSSISSGISDINEIPTDLTSSSVNSELSSPYASLQRGGGESNNSKRGELHKQIDPQSIIYRVVGSRSRRSVESSKSPIQLDSSARSPLPCQQGGNGRSAGISLPGSKQKECNGYLKSSPGGSSHSGAVGEDFRNSARDHHHGLLSPLGANNGIQSAPFSPTQQQHLASSSHKRSLNNLDLKAKKGMIGLKEEYYGREMADRLIKEEREREKQHDRHRSHGHVGSNGSSGGHSGDGKRAHSVKLPHSSSSQQQQNPNFGYVRRSTGSGIGGSGHSVSNTKYSIPVNGNGKVTLSGMKDMLTAEEFKAAHAALAIATGNSSPHHSHNSPYSVINSAQHSSGSTASPKTRTKVKVSGGTQTTNDLHELSGRQHPLGHPHHPHYSYQPSSNASEVEYASSTCSRNSGSFASSRHDPSGSQTSAGVAYKSLSLTTPTATQLSQSLRERILGSQSLPKGATSADYAALLAAIQHQQQHQQIYGTPNASKDRMSRYMSCKTMMNDGSLSDTGGYANYGEIQAYALSAAAASNSSPYSWMRHSTGYASSITSAPTRLMGAGSMTEAESMESLSSSSSVAAQLRDARSNGSMPGRVPLHTRDKSPSQSPRLNRSNSIRSTKSEKLYPSMLQRTEDVGPYYSSTISAGGGVELPTSPIHGTSNRLA